MGGFSAGEWDEDAEEDKECEQQRDVEDGFGFEEPCVEDDLFALIGGKK